MLPARPSQRAAIVPTAVQKMATRMDQSRLISNHTFGINRIDMVLRGVRAPALVVPLG